MPLLRPDRTPGTPRPGEPKRQPGLTGQRRPTARLARLGQGASPWLLAAAPLALLAEAGWLAGPASALLPVAQAVGRHLTSHTALPAWSVYLLGAGAATLAWRVGRGLTGWVAAPPAPRREDYVHDQFLGVAWEWRYDERDRVQQLLPRCPDCATRLVFVASRPGAERRIKMVCEHCRVQLLSEPGELDYLLARVARQVERKLHTGEWQDCVRQPPTARQPSAQEPAPAAARRSRPGLHVAA